MKFLGSLYYEARKIYMKVFCKLSKGNGSLSVSSLEMVWSILWSLLPPVINLVIYYINQIMIKLPELFGRKIQNANTKRLILLTRLNFPLPAMNSHFSIKYLLNFNDQHKCYYLPCETHPKSSRQNELLLFLGA